jgi:hypothetical protein
MSKANASKLWFIAALLTSGAAQAAAPVSVSEVPAAWYADRIVFTDMSGAAHPVFPSAAYEHGPTVQHQALPTRTRPSLTGMTASFPASPNETGPVL